MSIEIMNAVWKHSQATGRARLVLLAIADHQGEIGAWPSIDTLAKMVNASPRSVKRDIQELVALGELVVELQNAPTKGQYKSNLYWVTISGVTDSVNEVVSGVTETSSGVTDLTSGVTNQVSRGDTVGTQNLNITLIETLKETINVQNDFEQVFEQFWDDYPRKQGKGEARKALLKALNLFEQNKIFDGLNRFVSDPNRPKNPKFLPMPATWLNGQRWEDDLYPGEAKVYSAEEIKRIEEGYF